MKLNLTKCLIFYPWGLFRCDICQTYLGYEWRVWYKIAHVLLYDYILCRLTVKSFLTIIRSSMLCRFGFILVHKEMVKHNTIIIVFQFHPSRWVLTPRKHKFKNNMACINILEAQPRNWHVANYTVTSSRVKVSDSQGLWVGTEWSQMITCPL